MKNINKYLYTLKNIIFSFKEECYFRDIVIKNSYTGKIYTELRSKNNSIYRDILVCISVYNRYVYFLKNNSRHLYNKEHIRLICIINNINKTSIKLDIKFV